MNFFRKTKQQFKAFCFNLIEEFKNPISGYRVNFEKRKSKIKVDAITYASLENGKVVVNHSKMPILARLNYWRIGLWQYFKTYPSVAYSLILLPITLEHPELFPLGILIAGSIVYDLATGATTGGSPLTFTHTCSGTNRGVVVAVRTGTGNTSDPSSVTYNGVAMSMAYSRINTTNNINLSIWYLANPATGIRNVVVTTGDGSGVLAGAISFTGVHQTSMLDGFAGRNEAGVTSISTLPALTTTYANSMLVDVMFYVSADAPTPNTGQTERYTSNNGNHTIKGSTKPTTTAGSYSMGWTHASAVLYTIVAMGVREATSTAYYQTCSETLVLSDSRSMLISRALSEVLTLTDSIIKSTAKTLSDAIVLTDTLLKQISRIFNEAISLSDTFAFLKVIGRIFSETISLIDTLGRNITKVLAETLVLTDTLTKSIGRVFSDAVALTDTLSKIPAKIFSETLALSDTVVSKITGKILSETLSLSDTLTKSISRILIETLTLTDTLKTTLSKTLTEVLTLKDKFIPMLNGVLAWFTDKFSKRGTTFTDKHTKRGTTFTDKHTKRGTTFTDKFNF